jgi:hypothetical protein
MRRRWLAGGVVLAVLVGGAVWLADRAAPPSTTAPPAAREPPAMPRHLRVEDPARLDAARAAAIYEQIRSGLVAGYRLSRLDAAEDYVRWRRYNRVPYLSATHGDHYVNNYANGRARAYGSRGSQPEGAVFAKDSFTVTRDGDVYSGPLVLMEKMAPGYAPEGNDWRYTMIMPDGSLLGVTGGVEAGQVEYCRECHATAPAGHDHLFFVPEEFRREALIEGAGG